MLIPAGASGLCHSFAICCTNGGLLSGWSGPEWPPKKRPGRPNVVIVLVNMQVHVHPRHCNQDISKVAKYQVSGPVCFSFTIWKSNIAMENCRGFGCPYTVFRPFPRWNSQRKISPCLQVPRRLQTWQDRGAACALRSSLGHISSGLIKVMLGVRKRILILHDIP